MFCGNANVRVWRGKTVRKYVSLFPLRALGFRAMGRSCGDIPGGPVASRAVGQFGGLEKWGITVMVCITCLLVCLFV